MKIPYGICDFESVMTEGYFYCDRTDRFPALEEAGKYLLFIRPRRFGKSLLLSVLRNYYDLAKEDRFKQLFGKLAVGKVPTKLKNRYFVLQWDFSCVDFTGTRNEIRRALHSHVNSCISDFNRFYKKKLSSEIEIHEEDALSSLKNLVSVVRESGNPLYLLIDEYDNFASEIMMGVREEQDNYSKLVHEKGPLKTLFKAVKSAAGQGGIDRIFITGVSPVVMSDMTSGFNIAENIYLDPEFNDLCGFTEAETEKLLRRTAEECGIGVEKADEALSLMREYYNGYTFAPGSDQRVYNPTLALYFLKMFQKSGRFPRKMLDANLATDEAKLEYAASIPRGRQMLLEIARSKRHTAVNDIVDRFGIKEMLDDTSKDHDFLASFLYYFGVLTIEGERSDGNLELRVPNLVMRGLYVQRIQRMLLPEPAERDDGREAAGLLGSKGEMAPLCEFVEKRYFRVFHNPDYKWANELTVKTAFLTLLYNDILYVMDSEMETGRGYAGGKIQEPEIEKVRGRLAGVREDLVGAGVACPVRPADNFFVFAVARHMVASTFLLTRKQNCLYNANQTLPGCGKGGAQGSVQSSKKSQRIGTWEGTDLPACFF